MTSGAMDPSGRHLGDICAHVGVTWRAFGPIWGHLGHPGGTTWGHIGRVGDHPGVQGGLREGHVLKTFCFKVILRHLKKPQDEARNFEEDSMRAQGVLWEGHVLK